MWKGPLSCGADATLGHIAACDALKDHVQKQSLDLVVLCRAFHGANQIKSNQRVFIEEHIYETSYYGAVEKFESVGVFPQTGSVHIIIYSRDCVV